MTSPSAKELFRQTFGYLPTRQVRVPGRVILLGEHTRQQGGLILSACINRYLELAGSPRTDGQFEIIVYSPLIGITLTLGDLTVPTGDQNSLPDEFEHQCRSAARELRTASLRSVDLPWLKTHRRRLTKLEFECAYHVVTEAQRAIAAEKALFHDDYAQFGTYLTQSQGSADETLLCVRPELRTLVARVAQLPGCLGARFCGPNRQLLSIVHFHRVEPFLRSVSEVAAPLLGRDPRPAVVQLVDGAARPVA